jgi:hypothetical protein
MDYNKVPKVGKCPNLGGINLQIQWNGDVMEPT